MYVLSLTFLLASVVSLLLGVRRGGLTLVFVSIGCSVLAALFLAASVLRRRSEQPEVGDDMPKSSVDEWRSAPLMPGSPTSAEDRIDSEGTAGLLAQESLVGVVDRPVAGRHATEREASPTTPDSSAEGVLGPDVLVSDRGTYHLPSCEHAGGHSSTNMERAIAKRLGYIACGVCRPG